MGDKILSSLMGKKLKKLRGERLIAVMDDGGAFLGRLDEFDKKTIVLTEVCEGPSSEINWSTLEGKEEDASEEDYGFVDWVCVNLEEVYLRTDHISRIWPWKHVEDYREQEAAERTPTYMRAPAVEIMSENEEM